MSRTCEYISELALKTFLTLFASLSSLAIARGDSVILASVLCWDYKRKRERESEEETKKKTISLKEVIIKSTILFSSYHEYLCQVVAESHLHL